MDRAARVMRRRLEMVKFGQNTTAASPFVVYYINPAASARPSTNQFPADTAGFQEGSTIENNTNRPRRSEDMERTRVQPAASAPKKSGAPKGGRRKKAKKEVSLAKRIFVGFVKFVAVCICLGIIGASVAAVALSMYIVKVTENDATILDLQNLELSYTTIIYYREENESGQEEWIEYARLTSAAEDRIWVDSAAISDNLKNAFIAIEDHDFYNHPGFNFKRTVYAFLNEVSRMVTGSYLRGNMQGASTIEQQLIKNITDDDESTGIDGYMRKVREIFRAIALDNRYSKEEILEALTLAECASIAAITNAPTKYSPITNPEDHLARRDQILYEMWQQEYISEAEYNEAIAEPLRLAETIVDPDAAQQSNNSWFTDTLIEEVIDDLMEQKGMDRNEANNYLYSGGLRIYATVVPSLQEKMENAFAAKTYWPAGTIEDYDSGKVDEAGNPILETIETSAAGVSINYKGELCAVVGSLGQKEGDRLQNLATTPRAVGSTMKGVAVYPLAIENNIATFSSTQMDSPLENVGYDEEGKPITGWPTNVDRWDNIPYTVYQAIKVSKNTIAARWGQQVGLSVAVVDTVDHGVLIRDPPARGLEIPPAGVEEFLHPHAPVHWHDPAPGLVVRRVKGDR